MRSPYVEKVEFKLRCGEKALLREIQVRHPLANRITDRQQFPQRIDWDYYGTDSRNQPNG